MVLKCTVLYYDWLRSTDDGRPIKVKQVEIYEKTRYDCGHLANQEIKRKFVEREVFANVNLMADYILNKSVEDPDAPFTLEDIENYYSYPEWGGKVLGEELYFGGGSEDDKKTFLEEFDRLFLDSDDLLADGEISEVTYEANEVAITEAKTEFEQAVEEPEPAEIFEWWIVSGWLCERLKGRGCTIIKDQNLWGRQTTGQAILLDYVISQICADIEILEGQRNSWAK